MGRVKFVMHKAEKLFQHLLEVHVIEPKNGSIKIHVEQYSAVWRNEWKRSVPSKIPQNHTVFLMDLMRIFPMGPRSFKRTFVLERSPLSPLGDLHPLLLLLL